MKNLQPLLPQHEPVEEIKLSEKHTKLKVFVVILASLIAIAAFVFGLISCLSAQKGWQEVEPAYITDNCSSDFTYIYYLEKGGLNGSTVMRSVKAAYTAACDDAFKIFNESKEFEDVKNLATLNKHPNAEVKVTGELYSALEKITAGGNRAIYLGPVYAIYNSLYNASSDTEAADLDPKKSEAVKSEISEILKFANSEEHINLTLLGENKVKLFVSKEYSEFFESESLGNYLDLFIYKNAFICDYLATRLQTLGYGGLLSSIDGYARSFVTHDVDFSIYIFDINDKYVINAASLHGIKNMSSVRFRNYGIAGEKKYGPYYTYEDGETVTPYLSYEGLSQNCIANLFTYSYELGCADVAIKSMPIYTSEEFSLSAIAGIKADKIYSVYCEDKKVLYNDDKLGDALVPYVAADIVYKKEYFD